MKMKMSRSTKPYIGVIHRNSMSCGVYNPLYSMYDDVGVLFNVYLFGKVLRGFGILGEWSGEKIQKTIMSLFEFSYNYLEFGKCHPLDQDGNWQYLFKCLKKKKGNQIFLAS